MKITVEDNDLLFAVFDAFDLPAIVPGGFDCGLHGFDAAVFGKYLIAMVAEARC